MASIKWRTGKQVRKTTLLDPRCIIFVYSYLESILVRNIISFLPMLHKIVTPIFTNIFEFMDEHSTLIVMVATENSINTGLQRLDARFRIFSFRNKRYNSEWILHKKFFLSEIANTIDCSFIKEKRKSSEENGSVSTHLLEKYPFQSIVQNTRKNILALLFEPSSRWEYFFRFIDHPISKKQVYFR